jgi:hypothetical protein
VTRADLPQPFAPDACASIEDRHLGCVHLDESIVDPEGCKARDQVLDRAQLATPAQIEGRAKRTGAATTPDNRDIRAAAVIGDAEDNPVIGRRGVDGHARADPRMKAGANDRKRLSEGRLPKRGGTLDVQCGLQLKR